MDLSIYLPPKAKTLVEFGCGSGELGRSFKRIAPFCHYIGVEQDTSLAAQAAVHLDEVVTAQAAAVSFEAGDAVDCLVYHSSFLRTGTWQEVLQAHAKHVSDDGAVVLFVENPAYFRRVLSSWRGEQLPLASLTVEEAVEQLTASGLFVERILPVEDAAARALMAGEAAQQLLCAAAAAASCTVEELDNAWFWSRFFVVRAYAAPPPARLFVRTILGQDGRTSAKCRIFDPDDFCRTLPGFFARQEANIELAAAPQDEISLLLCQRLRLGNEAWEQLARFSLAEGHLLVAEWDDDPRVFGMDEAERALLFTGAHAVQVSMESLAADVRAYNPHVFVMENQLARLPEPRVYDDCAPVTIFFGALNRQADAAEMLPALNEVLRLYGGGVRVKVAADASFFERLTLEAKELITDGADAGGIVPYEVYERALHTSDIALLPLADTPFNRRKSDLKFLECAAHGAVVLASPIVYGATVEDGRTGMIFRSVEEFSEKLSRLIEDAPLRRRMAAKAYEYVREKRLLSAHYEERVHFYRSLAARKVALDEELRTRLAAWQQRFGG